MSYADTEAHKCHTLIAYIGCPPKMWVLRSLHPRLRGVVDPVEMCSWWITMADLVALGQTELAYIRVSKIMGALGRYTPWGRAYKSTHKTFLCPSWSSRKIWSLLIIPHTGVPLIPLTNQNKEVSGVPPNLLEVWSMPKMPTVGEKYKHCNFACCC